PRPGPRAGRPGCGGHAFLRAGDRTVRPEGERGVRRPRVRPAGHAGRRPRPGRRLTPSGADPMPYPKIELHVHLEGTITPERLLEIARRNDYPLPADTVDGIRALYDFRDFDHFIEVWILVTNSLRRADDFRQIVVDYVRQAAAQGAV